MTSDADLLGWAAIVSAITALLGAVFAFVLALVQLRRTNTKLDEVKQGIQTNNGKTLGEMVQHGYSMAAQNVPPADRTPEQDDAVAMLTEQEHQTHDEQKDE